jgi:hypothetical protein
MDEQKTDVLGMQVDKEAVIIHEGDAFIHASEVLSLICDHVGMALQNACDVPNGPEKLAYCVAPGYTVVATYEGFSVHNP